MKQTAFYLFLGTLIFAPLAFGTVETWSYLIMELLVCTSAILLFISVGKKKYYQVPGLRPLAFVNAFILLQLIPLPGSLVNLLSPTTYAIYQNSAGLISGPIQWMPLSIFPRATMVEVLRFSTYVLFYTIAVQFFSDRRLLKTTITVITWLAGVLAIVGILDFLIQSLDYPFSQNKLFWLRELSQAGSPRGPYVNRNHYAGFMEMIFPLVLAIFLSYRPLITRLSIKKQIVDFFTGKQVHQHFFYGTAAVLIGLAILLSLSRGGIISLSLSMILFSGILVLKAKQKKAGLFIGFVVVIVLFLTGTSGWDAIFKRFEGLIDQSGTIQLARLIYWEDSINIIRDFPLTGSGTGTFEKIYPQYRSHPGNDILEHAHSDYLEFLATGGIILPALMAWGLLTIIYSTFRLFLRRREPYSILLFAGCLSSVSAILIHSLVDFNMQVGANGLYFYLILAMTVSAASSRMHAGVGSTFLKPVPLSPAALLIPVICLTTGIIYIHGGSLIAHYLLKEFRNVPLRAEMKHGSLDQIYKKAKIAAALDLLNPKYPKLAATAASLQSNSSEALNYYTTALRLDPTNSLYLTDAAAFMHQQGNDDQAATLFQSAIQYNEKNMTAYIRYAAMKFDSNEPEQGFIILKQAISRDVTITETCLALLVLHEIDTDQFHQALPERVLPHLVLGDFFVSLGENQKAEASYLRALDFFPDESQPVKHYFLTVLNFYLRDHAYEEALQIIIRAINWFPDDPYLHQRAGDLYKKLGIDHRADEAFRKARLLKQNTAVKKHPR